MKYAVEFKPRAVRDLEALSTEVVHRILERIEAMRDNLAGDVKRLTNFIPEYRLRVGDHRVLFEVEKDRIIVYRIRHRREAYRP